MILDMKLMEATSHAGSSSVLARTGPSGLARLAARLLAAVEADRREGKGN